MYIAMLNGILQLNIVSPFRDLCLETIARFTDDKHKCVFHLSTEENILQKSRLFTILNIVV